MKKLMHMLARLFPSGASGENPAAIRAYQRMLSVKDWLVSFSSSHFIKGPRKSRWPAAPGNYRLGNPDSFVAVCTLTSDDLIEKTAALDNVAISGGVCTPNLGIEKIIINCTSNPNIRFLLLCGKDSSVFYPGQAIASLAESGYDREKRINKATGHFPVLRNIKRELIDQFLDQVKVIDNTGEREFEKIRLIIDQIIKRNSPKPYEGVKSGSQGIKSAGPDTEGFTEINPGGRRIPIAHDEKGFFLITTDPSSNLIIVKHYFNENKPGYIIRGKTAESIYLALARDQLVSQLSHAGYLGAELSKAETSLRLGLQYQQDKPLRKK